VSGTAESRADSTAAEAIESAAAMLGSRAQRQAPLGARTTYRVGGPAAILFEAETEDDLARIREAVAVTGVPLLVVGRGSNLLVADSGFAGVAVALGQAFAVVEITGSTVTAGAGASLPVVARRTAAVGLRGFEWAVGVPGSIGGAVRMNAGGHGSEMRQVLVHANVFDLAAEGGTVQPRLVAADDLDLSYRHSSVAPAQVVVSAVLLLEPGRRDDSEALIDSIVEWRRRHQPGGQNAGSVFTNPPGDSAGRLVEAAGLRGLRRGTAQVSPRHANFVQAAPEGSADDVRALILEVRRLVEERTGILLQPEVKMVGFPGD